LSIEQRTSREKAARRRPGDQVIDVTERVVDLTVERPMDDSIGIQLPADSAPDERRPTPRKFRPDIQGLRTIAVLVVALYHAGVPFLPGGYVGVDVFFVISGFLITRQLFGEASVRGTVNLVKFYSQRFRRLLPPVVLVVGTTLAVAHYVLPYTQLKSLVKDVYYASFYGINYHFAHEGVQYQNASAPPSPLQHFWSLAVEEQFYVFWPILIILCAVIGRRKYRHALTIGVIAALTLVTLYYSVKISSSNKPTAYFSLQTRAWELGLGALVALTADRWARLPSVFARIFGWAGLTAILATSVLYTDRTVYPGIAALVPVAGTALLIGSGVLRNQRTPETVLLERPFMQYGGRVSYAWYLWHWPMLILLPAWVGHALNTWENVEIVFLALWFAVLTYFLENASHRSSWSYRRWMRTGLLLSATVALFALISGATLPSLLGTGQAQNSLALRSADLTEVQAAVNKSLGIEQVPSNLTPTLAKATLDTPWEGSSKCFGSLTDVRTPACVFGDKTAPANRTAVLVGDSHADQWLTALSQDAVPLHWKIIQLTKAACPVADMPVWNNDLGRSYTECAKFQQFVKTKVAEIKPALVIASQANVIPDRTVLPEVWSSKTVQALDALAGKTAKIAYIGDSPTTVLNTATCLETHLSSTLSCAYKRVDAFKALSGLDYANRYQSLGKAMTAAHMGYVDTINFFCGKAMCPALVNNMLVHRDEGHITNTYAMWLKAMLAPIFTGASK
jgi:peptidoglycan/LPS O-acetylase OafA/YrhL